MSAKRLLMLENLFFLINHSVIKVCSDVKVPRNIMNITRVLKIKINSILD